MELLSSTYSPKDIESKHYKVWESNNYFVPQGKSPSYSIVIPPPNVTGNLHMGHGFQHTLMDALIRYKRMCGIKTLWQPGTDHAGIATQMVVEKKLLQEGITRHDLGREKFIEKIWEWKKHSGSNISNQIRRLGASLDWSREKFTLDESMSHAVIQVFVQLYRENLIYRGKKLVNWDPVLGTAISDLEVINQEEQGKIWEIKYPLADHNESITIATTRPETLFGDVAVAVHPEDDRYRDHIGKYLKLPLTERLIPIISDSDVEQNFGTGCVKITPAHDFNDNAIGARHNLAVINILNRDATLNDQVPPEYQNLNCQDARNLVLKNLKQQGFLVSEKDHTLMVPRGDRSGSIIEPLLTDQWFVDIKPLAEPAIKAVESGEIKFVPENWENTYFQWMNNIQDWCISRQLWWGHRIPAWYDENNNVYVGSDEQDVRAFYNIDEDVELNQDNDVLDTWFSSALWPFATLGWPDNDEFINDFYPTNVLVTGFDIIFFWVARMIMFSLKFTGKIPFKEVYITGLIRDSHGQKMSKSKGNILDPLDLIDGISLEDLLQKRTKNLMQPDMLDSIKKHTIQDFPNGIEAHGTDAVRFNFCALASTGRDIKYDMDRLLGYRNFCNKLWNAARFVLMQCVDDNYHKTPNDNLLSPADRWITSKFQSLVKNIHDNFDKYRFDHIAQNIQDFVWNDYCAWYLEMAKQIINDENTSREQKYASCHTLINMLDNIVRIMHPITPFITEEIWEHLKIKTGDTSSSLMIAAYPIYQEKLFDDNLEEDMEFIQGFIEKLRNIKSELNISPKISINLDIFKIEDNEKNILSTYHNFITKLAKIDNISYSNTPYSGISSTLVYRNIELSIPLDGLIDISAEKDRIYKSITKLKKEQEKLDYKINKTKFTSQAPSDVVAKERDKLNSLKLNIDSLESKIKQLS